jgi:hypothetical protein
VEIGNRTTWWRSGDAASQRADAALVDHGGDVRWKEGRREVGGARRGQRHDRLGRCRKLKNEGGEGRERDVGKAAGDERVFIPGEGLGW